MAATVLEYINQIENLPVLPEIGRKILALTEVEQPDLAAIAALIQKDPAITAKILKIINSGYYALRQEVTNVQQAVVMLGLEKIRNLVLTMVSVNHFEERPGAHIKLSDFWNHSLGVATIAQCLGERFSIPNPNDLYLCGLLHDIGKVIIQTYYPIDMFRIIRIIDKEQCSMLQAEEKLLGFHHPKIGAALVQRWNFPERISDAIEHHHDCENACDPFFAAVLQFADLLTKARLYAVYGDQNFDVIFEDEVCWHIIVDEKHKEVDLERLLFEMDDEIDRARELVKQARGS